MSIRPSGKVELDIRDIMDALRLDGEKFLKDLMQPPYACNEIPASPNSRPDSVTFA